MQIIYNREPIPKEVINTIFLAGPTNIKQINQLKRPSWRNDAINILKSLGYDGIVYCPEDNPNSNETFENLSEYQYEKQVDWERNCLSSCDAIIMWIPRFDDHTGLTTNIEFGLYYKTKKIFLGFPDNSIKNEYIEEMYKNGMDMWDGSLPIHSTLKETIEEVLSYLKPCYRQNNEVMVPQNIFLNDQFQDWYKLQKNNLNDITYFNNLFILSSRNNPRNPFIWSSHVHMYNNREKRRKVDECIFSRPDISSMMVWSPNEDIMKSRILLVKEYRVTSRNFDSFIYELPSGSIDADSGIENSLKEFQEETGIHILAKCQSNNVPIDFKYHGDRQCAGTFSLHKCKSYSLQITDDIMNQIIEETKNKIFGIRTEWTYVEIKTLEEILNENLLDWTNIGMILKIINDDKSA